AFQQEHGNNGIGGRLCSSSSSATTSTAVGDMQTTTTTAAVELLRRIIDTLANNGGRKLIVPPSTDEAQWRTKAEPIAALLTMGVAERAIVRCFTEAPQLLTSAVRNGDKWADLVRLLIDGYQFRPTAALELMATYVCD